VETRIAGRTVTLVDTPGFDDKSTTAKDVLQSIQDWEKL